MMPRLYLRFYLALLGSLIAFAVATAMIWHRADGPVERGSTALGMLVQNALPASDAPIAEQQQALRKLIAGVDADIELIGADHSRIAQANGLHPTSSAAHSHDDMSHRQEATIHLPDGRELIATAPIGAAHPLTALLMMMLLLALAVAVGAYPIVRRLTKRLERLQRGVESLGAGELSARVAVEGSDEVAMLAESFNRAAARIEQLVAAHKTLLANASHELRTPLARIRMTIELMKASADPKRKAALEQDIAELDELIGEILLASRLDAVDELEHDEDVDLLALAAEECARYPQAQLDGVSVHVRGDARLLRRLLRNLLENAERHGVAPTLVNIARQNNTAEIRVSDAGPAIPAGQRERLFEPFYRRAAQSGENKGAGLGLALVRQIARRHGGDARCEADETGRTGFIVTLPATQA
jgi:signal transduction histidine kinase